MCKPRSNLLLIVAWFFLAGVASAAGPASFTPPEVERAWFRLTGALDPLDVATLRERTEELLKVASALEIRRLTPYAQALALKARTLTPAQQSFLLGQALRLDRDCPEVLFQLATLRLRQLQPGGVLTALKGFLAFFADGRLMRFRQASLLFLVLLVVLVVGCAWAVLAVGQTLPRLWHDLGELGQVWRLGANGWVFSLFAMGLPLFFALDPLWWFFWLVALCWGYWRAGAKFLGAAFLVVCLASPTLLEVAQRSFAHPPDPLFRAAMALQEGRYDPPALLELDGVADLFAEDPDFYRLKGDLERQFGLFDASLLTYQAGLRLQPDNAPLLLAAGCVHFLQGNYGAAVQLFTQARDRGYDPVVANYNLSLAFAHVYNFRDSDEAIAAARKASETRLRRLSKGRDSRAILPVFTLEEAELLRSRKDPVTLLNRGLALPPLSRQRTIFSPVTLASVFALLLALAHSLWRQRRLGFARACSKCGRTFCSRCKLSRESQSYCTQCVNIFLKRDMVAPELQIAKQQQLARRQRWLWWRRRIADTLLPGLGLALAGRPLLGVLHLVPAAFLSLAGLIWLPGFVQPLLLHTSMAPIKVLTWVLWALPLVSAQRVRTEGS